MTTRLLVLALSLLVACSGGESPKPGEPGAGGPGAAGAPGAPGAPGEGGPGEGGPAELEIPSEPQHSQEALSTEGGVTLTGKLECDEGRGPFIVQVFPPPPKEPGEEGKGEPDGGPSGPVVKIQVDEPGPFTLLAPKDGGGVIVAFEDLDGDGKPTPGEALLFEGGGGPQPVVFSGDRSGLSINCDAALGSPGGGPAAKIPPVPKGGPGDAPVGDAEGQKMPPKGEDAKK